MRVPIRPLLAGVAILLAGNACAQEPNPLTAVRADRWADAQAEAARFADPVAEKLVLYLRLRAPGAATASEIADFMHRNPDWPAQALLERRRQEALAADPDDAAVLAQCAEQPSTTAAILRCAAAMANAGRSAEAVKLARKAWVHTIGSQSDEAAFLQRWGTVADPDDQWARFQRLAWSSDQTAAERQISRLDPAHQAAAHARLAAQRDDPQTESLIAALPPALQDDPGLTLDRARSFRRTGHPDTAAALLNRTPDTANPRAFWSERNRLARDLLRAGDAKTAYAVVAAHSPTNNELRAEAEFFAGFIALRMLHDPATAKQHFSTLADSTSAITQSRAHYWLARSAAMQGGSPTAEFQRAATWPTTFYGQLAALALGQNPATLISRLRDPGWTPATAFAFTEHEVLRAAAWLIAWGDPSRARAFLTRMDELAPVVAERALTAAFALSAGVPDGAVFVARRMGRDGIALPHRGWPAPFNPDTPPDPAFSLAIMRQESSFDVTAMSPSGARGLMQLMPPTAAEVAKRLGISVSLSALTADPRDNIQLGTAYLQEMLTRFDNCLPLAAAAYNAGPRRVAQWLTDNGDPRLGPIDMVDWIELIPAEQTRNYVQRVTENVVMYRAARGNPAPVLDGTPWTR